MAKEPQTSAVSIAPPQVAGGSGDSRSVMIDVPMTDGSTRKMSRTDYCKQRYTDGADRGTIRKELEQITGKNIAYQTVFSATKDLPDNGTNRQRKPKAEAKPAEAAS